jgi:hypothetical protein
MSQKSIKNIQPRMSTFISTRQGSTIDMDTRMLAFLAVHPMWFTCFSNSITQANLIKPHSNCSAETTEYPLNLKTFSESISLDNKQT